MLQKPKKEARDEIQKDKIRRVWDYSTVLATFLKNEYCLKNYLQPRILYSVLGYRIKKRKYIVKTFPST